MDTHIVQIISDIHLDVRKCPLTIESVAPTLIVAGDVASHTDPMYRDYLQTLFKNHTYGIYVPGNHDIWGASSPISFVHDYMRKTCKSLDSNVSFLGVGDWGIDLPNTNSRIMGATLWTHIPESMAELAPSLMNDYNAIQKFPGINITASDVNVMHEKDKEWISKAILLANQEKRAAVVVTHHAPDAALSVHNDIKALDGMGVFYYNTDMQDVLKKPGIVAWMYGHTHESIISSLKNIRYPFITNALGYPYEHTGFVEDLKVKIP